MQSDDEQPTPVTVEIFTTAGAVKRPDRAREITISVGGGNGGTSGGGADRRGTSGGGAGRRGTASVERIVGGSGGGAGRRGAPITPSET